MMEMKERKKKILEAIIKDYINTAEPVGSRTLSKRYDLGISPATIRNEMADLEEMGFLIQPHTSSGRIPTQKAYRFYVDEIMQIKKLAETVRRDIHQGYLTHSSEMLNTMQHTADVISEMTNYTSVVLAPKVSRLNCKHVQIIPLIRERILIVIVTVEGIAKNIEMNLSRAITIDEAQRLSNVLNRLLNNIVLQEIDAHLIEEIRQLDESEGQLLMEMLPVIRDALIADASEVHTGGLTNLFHHPEFSDVNRVKNLVKIIEDKQFGNLISLPDSDHSSLRIVIGNENDNEDLKEFSIITTTYEVSDNVVGVFGVIGPTRMDYDQVSAVLETIRNELNQNIKKLIE